MKSRKFGFLGFGKRKSSETRRSKKLALTRCKLELLERREVFAADWSMDPATYTADFVSNAKKDAALSWLASKVGDQAGLGNRGGESEPTLTTVQEVETNNSFSKAQKINLSSSSWIALTGSSSTVTDVDWVKFDLKGGDILDLNLVQTNFNQGTLPLLSLYNSSGAELISVQGLITMPAASPLTQPGISQSASGSLHYIAPSDGTYYVQASQLGSTYTNTFRVYRPTLESQPVGTNQILFLDFDGANVSRDTFGVGPGFLNLAPLSRFVTNFGLQTADTNAFIREITRRVQTKFDQLAADTKNPNFKITIKNSLDDGDLWGNPNVTRVIVGDTLTRPTDNGIDTFLAAIYGVAESVDPGNFNTEETAILLVNNFVPLVQSVPVTGTATVLQLASEVIARTIAHEAGHTFGAWHQTGAILTNGNVGIMTAGGNATAQNRAGTGPDGIFGTVDDTPARFTNDDFQDNGIILEGGQDDTVNWLGWGLTSGQTGAQIQGTAFQDNNLNRGLDSQDTKLSSVVIYADLNNNSTLDSGEYSTTSNSTGAFTLKVPVGATYTVRSVVPTGYKVVTPSTNSYSVAVTTAATQTAKNFGFQLIPTNATGLKFNDTNGNGLRDTGEAGVGGVWIYYDLDGDGRLDIGEPSIQSKADGSYTLPSISAGTYVIREVLDPGWVQTLPGASGGYGYTVTLTGNAVNDAPKLAGLDFGNQLIADFGDAPATYGDASAGFVAGLTLGTAWDSETASQYTSDASGDDNTGTDDEDGVTLTAPLVRGSTTNAFTIATTNTTGQAATLNVWLDLDRNGTFESSEKIADPTKFTIASTVATGPVFARFRYGLQANVGPTGYTSSGEVEDYVFNISDTTSIAVDDTDTVQRNGSKTINVLANDFGTNRKVISASGTTSAGGSAAPTSDGSGVLYIAPQGFIGTDTFQYTMQNSTGQTAIATVTIDVSLFFDNPVAVDDSYDLPTNSIDYPLNVLANDIEGKNGALTIVSVVQPDKGGQVSIATGGKSLRYTPSRNFGGTEFVSYTVADSAGNTSTANVTLHTLEGDRDDDQVQIRLEAVDATTGAVISQIQQGQDFKVKVYVDDLRFDSSNPGSGAGVFAAYFDLLYNLQLVSTKAVTDSSSRFNFDVKFLGDYVNFTTGDASIPGVINEFGATSSNFNMQAPNELPLAELTFTARSPGIVNFAADPADVFPRSETLLFNTPDAVPIERIRYKGTQLQIFGDGVQFPVAVDDSTRVFGVNSAKNTINVLANDLTGSTGTVTIVSASQGSHGFTSINRGVSSLPVDDYIEYTPATNYSGFDQFTYTIQDARGIQSTATVTVHVGTAGSLNPDSDDVIDYELVVTDLNGTPIDQVTQGQQFQLRAFVKDLRTQSATAGRDTRGIFAAYQDILFNRNLVSAVSSSTNDPNLGFQVSFGPLYNRVREGDIRTAGVLNEIGAVATYDSPEAIVGTNPLGYLDRRLPLFTVTMTANRVGTAEFFSDPVDISPLHDSLTFDPAAVVTPDKIHFGYDSVKIVSTSGSGSGEYFNSSNPTDVNNDGFTSPIDALLIINLLNSGGGGWLSTGSGEGEPGKYYYDTNNDGKATASDALKVINGLMNKGSGEGEGVLAAALSVPQIETSSGRLEAEGEATTSAQPIAGASSSLTGPSTTSASYMMPADSWFASQSEDDSEDDSLLDDLASDISSCWNS